MAGASRGFLLICRAGCYRSFFRHHCHVGHTVPFIFTGIDAGVFFDMDEVQVVAGSNPLAPASQDQQLRPANMLAFLFSGFRYQGCSGFYLLHIECQ